MGRCSVFLFHCSPNLNSTWTGSVYTEWFSEQKKNYYTMVVVISTQLKRYSRQHGKESSPSFWVKIKDSWNHHLVYLYAFPKGEAKHHHFNSFPGWCISKLLWTREMSLSKPVSCHSVLKCMMPCPSIPTLPGVIEIQTWMNWRFWDGCNSINNDKLSTLSASPKFWTIISIRHP